MNVWVTPFISDNAQLLLRTFAPPKIAPLIEHMPQRLTYSLFT